MVDIIRNIDKKAVQGLILNAIVPFPSDLKIFIRLNLVIVILKNMFLKKSYKKRIT